MQKTSNKIMALVIAIIIIAIQILPVSVIATEQLASDNEVSNVASNATNETNVVNESIENVVNEIGNGVTNEPKEITTPITDEMKTSEKNVLADVTVNGNHSAKVDINDEIVLEVYTRVLNGGYLRNIEVKIGDNNYTIDKDTMQNFNGVNANNNLELNEVQAGEEVKASVKAKFEKNEIVKASDFNKESKITFSAVYVNETGKERKVEKEVKLKVEWTADQAEETIYQELIRYIRFDNRTMISFRINDAIKDNLIPVKEKEIKTKIPQINNKQPSIINIVGDYDEYSNENGTLVIKRNNIKIDEDEEDNKNNKDKEDEYNWSTDNSYIVTYIYDGQEDLEILKSNSEAKVKTILDQEFEAKTEIENDVKEEVGSLIELDLEGTPTLNKGYMYTNLARADKINTEFNTAYKLNIGFKDVVDKVVLKENAYSFNEFKTEVINKKVNTHIEELKKVLGEDGIITIFNKEGEKIGELNKDTEEVEVDTEELSFETSKPVAEGIITINIEKKMNDNLGYTREDIKLMQTLNTFASLEGILGENSISKKDVENTIKLEEPESSADIAMEPRNLSTAVDNQDVQIDVRLNTSDIEDALFTNPEIRIKLPDQVKGINVSEAKLIYDNELKPVSLDVVNNMIIAKLEGTQTEYNADGIINGSIIKILANVAVDKMATTSDEKIILGYANEATGEIKEKEIETDIVAPEGFITTHTIETDNISETAFEGNKEIQIMQGTAAKVAKISGKAINNLGRNADGFTIIGRIPAEGIQNFSGEDLQTNVTTNLRTQIHVNNLEKYKVYYSDNVNETFNGNWSLNPTATSKSFKVVAEEEVPQAKEVSFDYEITIPENVDSGKDMSALYGVVYATNAVEGEQYNVVSAKTVGAFTEGNDTLSVNTEIYNRDDNTRIIDENTKPKSGEDVVYKVTIKNNGKTTLNNINLIAEVNDKINFLKNIGDSKGIKPDVEVESGITQKTLTIDSLAAGETRTFVYEVRYGIASTKDEVISDKVSYKLASMDFTDEEKAAYVAYMNGLTNPPGTKTWEQLTNQINNLAGQYQNLSGWLDSKYTATITQEEIDNHNTARMTIKTTYGSRNSVMSREDVIENYTGAYMTLSTNNEGFIQKDGEVNVTATVRAAATKATGRLKVYINMPHDMSLISIRGGDINTEDTTKNRPVASYYVSNNGQMDTTKVELDMIELNNKKAFLQESGIVKINLKFKANKVTADTNNVISGYVTDTAYTVDGDNNVTYGDTKTVGSNSLNILVEKEDNIRANQTCSIGGNTIDTTPIYFYIHLISESRIDRTVNILDSIPEGLEVTEVYLDITKDGKTVRTGGKDVTQGVAETFELPSGAEAVLEIRTMPLHMEAGSSDLFTSSPVVTSGTLNITVNEVSVTVYGTAQGDVDPVNPDPTPDTPIDTTKTYQLNGVVWKDENYDGIRDVNDTRIKNTKLDLYKKIIENGIIKDIEYISTTTSNGLGEYTFKDVQVGDYYIIAEYDSKEYIVTKYRVDKSNDMNNNDFTEQTLDGKKVATATLGVRNTDLYNLDLGLATRKNFSFKLEKFITKATITNPEYEKREYNFVNKHTAKIELPAKNIENTTVIAEYTIKVTNIGKVSGTIENIADYLPQGMTFNGELNNGWYLSNDGNLYNTSLASKELALGETAEVKLILTRKINGENLGLVHNISEIYALSSKSAQEPDGITPGNRQDGEDDMSSADLIILMGTGRETASIVGITVLILALIACSTYIMKKFVMDKAI